MHQSAFRARLFNCTVLQRVVEPTLVTSASGVTRGGNAWGRMQAGLGGYDAGAAMEYEQAPGRAAPDEWERSISCLLLPLLSS
jgi:hypothetical protein